MKFIDDKSKNVKWWNRNYFYAGTIIIIAINIMLFAFAGNDWESIVPIDNEGHWEDVFYFDVVLRAFLNSFSHANWQHVLLNMLCFAGVGFYLERKTGSFGILFLVIISAFFSSIAVSANDLGVYWHGFSGVNYFLYAYSLIDYIFSFQKSKRNRTNIILGGIILALIYLAMCFNGGTSEFGFEWYPYDLMHNLGHYTSFLAGLIFGITIKLIQCFERNNCKIKQI